MALINEPKGIDFLIKSPPLTDDERVEISELIKKIKKDHSSNRKKVLRKKKAENKSIDALEPHR